MQSKSKISTSEISLSLSINEKTPLLLAIPPAKKTDTHSKPNNEKKSPSSTSASKTTSQSGAGSTPTQEAKTALSKLKKEESDLPTHLWLLKQHQLELLSKDSGDYLRFGAPASAILDDEDDPQVEEEYQKILSHSASKM